MKFRRLRGEIRRVFYTEKAAAEALGITSVSLCNKLQGKQDFKLKEVKKLSKLLGIERREIARYFFEGDD